MKEIFHYHITVEGITSEQLRELAKSLSAKATTIDLFTDENTQKDRMITKYSNKYRQIRADMFEDVEEIINQGFGVARAKIEQVTPQFWFDEDALYSEAHIKVDENSQPIVGLHLSNNPVDGTRFYNARARDLGEFFDGKFAILGIENSISEQYELCWFDSNISHDSWWTDG